MCKFEQATYSDIPLLENLHRNFKQYLEDDFSQEGLQDVLTRTAPFFWKILSYSENQLAGYVYLDNITGNKSHLYSAEITTCFYPAFWGDFTKYSAKIFLNLCFKTFGFTKLKALVYQENHRVKNLLTSCGFFKEACLINETVHKGKPQNIEIYSVFKNYYEVKNENEN